MTQSQPAPEFRYWAFISYSHKDKSWGSWLHKALETYRVPKRLVGMPIAAGKIPARLTPIFRDRDELPTASDLGSAIEEALRQSWSLIVICSPGSAESRWVNEEVLAFQRLGRGERIHCLIVDAGSDVAAPLVFPPALGSRAPTVDGRVGEPIAADARPFGDGRSGAKLKLIAGVLGIGYDTLVQREHQRRHRNLFTVTCAALALVVVLAVSTIVAITSRRDAVNQRGHAENLVEFMIGDLRKKLEPDGKLATLDAVGKEALAYYASQKSEDLDADGLARRARALHMIGEVYDLRGELDEALKVFEQAADSTKELLERDPDNGQRVFDHAQSVYWVGYIAYQRGDAGIATPAFEDYKRLAEKLVAIDPENENWQAEVGYANSNLGTLLYDQGRLDEAGNVFSQELEMARQLGQRAPRDFARQLRSAQAHAWLSDVRRSQGRFADAARNRLAEIAIYQGALKDGSTNHDAEEALLVSWHHLAVINIALGNMNVAREQIESAFSLGADLNRIDPENSRWMELSSGVNATLAEILALTGDMAAANVAAERANAQASNLVGRDPSVLSWQFRWAGSRFAQARLAAASGDSKTALQAGLDVVQRLHGLKDNGMRTWERTRALVRAHWLLADLYRILDQGSEAERNWLQLIELSSEAQTPLDPSTQAARAIALQEVSRRQEAETIFKWLDEINYHESGYEIEKKRLGISDGYPNGVAAEKAPQT